jgi:hypothetical protein
MFDNELQVLRFVAKFENPNPQDVGRVFEMIFDMADDQISVFENPKRNPGFNTGEFIQRAKIKNPVTAQYFKTNEIRIGKLLTVRTHQFKLIGADEFALARMKAE